mgnify:CR=1 FL=1
MIFIYSFAILFLAFLLMFLQGWAHKQYKARRNTGRDWERKLSEIGEDD